MDGGDVLGGTNMCDVMFFHSVVPQTEIDKLAEEPGADDLEFTSKDTAWVDVAREK
jgi:hypothetical protein